MISKFFAANRRVCARIEPYLPQAETRLFPTYEKVVARYMNAEPGQVVVDAGGGKQCRFAKYKDPISGTKIIGVDISAEELEHNADVDDKRVANLMQGLPFDREEIDVLVSRSVLEHLEDLESFVANSAKALKPGGYSIHLFPSRYAPFVLINRALPHSHSRKMLYFFRPESKGGFPAFYDRCYYSGVKRLFEKHGFEVIDERLGYYQSRYFRFFVPFFLASALYEVIVRALGAKDLAAYVLMIARKR